MLSFRPLGPIAKALIETLEEKEVSSHEEHRITVNPIVSKFASWYERLRNAMEFREDEVILRATIERVLKRRLLLGGNGATTAEPLIKELLWARYLPDHDIGESVVEKVRDSIDLYLSLRLRVLSHHHVSESTINEWIYDLMSADIQYILNFKKDKELMTNFMFHVLKDDVVVQDEAEETKDAQVFMAVRKAFARDDLAFLRYHLFSQYFGKLTPKTLDYTVTHFIKGYHEIQKQINHPLKDKIYTYAKRRTAAFFILDDVLSSQKDNLKTILESEEALEEVVFEACEKRYKSIGARVRRAIIRSVLFIALTKVAFAFAVEGSYERFIYGHVIWSSIVLNTSMPPVIMIIVSLFIRTPGIDNSRRILQYITELLYEKDPRLGNQLIIGKKKDDNQFMTAFNILWLGAFLISFGGITLILSKLHFNLISQFIFIFFLAIVSFLSYRISLIANTFKVGERQGLLTLIVDFLFMPVIIVGRKLTQSIAQINIFLMLFDFFIEAPFKYLFAFLDQWFYFLHNKTEELE